MVFHFLKKRLIVPETISEHAENKRINNFTGGITKK